MEPAPNTLGLDDDLDGVELVCELEKSFGLTIPNDTAAAMYTVGDIYRFLESHFHRDGRTSEGCATAMAFYRLRRAAAREFGVGRVGPAFDLTTLPVSARQMFAALQTQSGLSLPERNLSGLGVLGAFLAVAALLAIFPLAVFLPWPVLLAVPAVFALAWMAVRLDPGRVPRDCATLGDLARRTADLNFGALAHAGASTKPKDIWNAMLGVFSRFSPLPPAQVHPGTILLQSQLPRRARGRAPS